MTDDKDETVRRVRRGCLGIAILLTATTLMLVFTTGNLAYGLLLVLPLLAVILGRAAR